MKDLDAFLAAAKSHGANDEFLVQLLKQHGWSEREVYVALGRHYAEATGLAMPAPRSRLETAREAFFHLLAFGTLGTWIFSLGSIWFLLIEFWFPDVTGIYGYRYQDSFQLRRITWELASILVAFPAFLFATRAVLHDLEQNPGQAASPVRRWLTNIALLFTSLIAICDVVTFLAYFLQGDLTARFTCKVVVVLVLAAAVYSYYGRGLQQDLPLQAVKRWNRVFAALAAAALVATFVLGFWKTGSPAHQRLLTEDASRVQDLHRLAQTINTEWSSQKEPLADRKLPATLETVAQRSSTPQIRLQDPFNGQLYEYHPGKGQDYTLCAQFHQAARGNAPGASANFWDHPEGRHCFAFTAATAPPWPGRGGW